MLLTVPERKGPRHAVLGHAGSARAGGRQEWGRSGQSPQWGSWGSEWARHGREVSVGWLAWITSAGSALCGWSLVVQYLAQEWLRAGAM